VFARLIDHLARLSDDELGRHLHPALRTLPDSTWRRCGGAAELALPPAPAPAGRRRGCSAFETAGSGRLRQGPTHSRQKCTARAETDSVRGTLGWYFGATGKGRDPSPPKYTKSAEAVPIQQTRGCDTGVVEFGNLHTGYRCCMRKGNGIFSATAAPTRVVLPGVCLIGWA
jgi:hypothetical protein